MKHDSVLDGIITCADLNCAGLETGERTGDDSALRCGPAAAALKCAAPSHPPFLSGSCQRDWVNEMWAQADRGCVPGA